MKIDIRCLSFETSEALKTHTERRIHFLLSRFGTDIGTVHVRLSDVNGPRGGLDKRCHVTLHGPRLGSVVVDELSADAYASVNYALHRAARVVSRELDRVRSVRSLESELGRAS